jgi:hypothetical protein
MARSKMHLPTRWRIFLWRMVLWPLI